MGDIVGRGFRICQESMGMHPKGMSYATVTADRHVFLAPLDHPDIGSVQPGFFGQLLLGEGNVLAGLTDS